MTQIFLFMHAARAWWKKQKESWRLAREESRKRNFYEATGVTWEQYSRMDPLQRARLKRDVCRE